MNKQAKPKIRKGDMVRVLTGKDRGKTGKVMAVLPADNRVLVEAVNMVKKHVRPKRAGEKGQRVSVAAPLHISNVQIICPGCKKSTKVAIKKEGKARTRSCRRCGAAID
jgi:large subunit ribosomal protein L24